MVSVRINGEDSPIVGTSVPRIVDLIELIKSQIDPDHMITRILLDGRELDEAEWFSSTNGVGTAILEIETGTPDSYVNDRLRKSADIVAACFTDFRDARKLFQSGDMQSGNKKLITGVQTLKAFFEWYASLLELVKVEERPKYDISLQVEQIAEACKKACQHQLYQSWWALGETLEKELEPMLDKLEDFCRAASPA